ncbi:hypothetical protein [Paraburkholderia bannensis]|uniref:hypothetical protein n=1 Tax=Paraburkholderia bannensis TaxID=765414 RepID=UPI002AB75D14|nr:hypothetical protein [Paraburkholderia bannensis]
MQDINAKKTAWLHTENYFGGFPIRIMAGVSLQRFTELVELAGGMVYAPAWLGPVANVTPHVGYDQLNPYPVTDSPKSRIARRHGREHFRRAK